MTRAPRFAFLCLLVLLTASSYMRAAETSGPGYKFHSGGWTYVHLEGAPEQIGFQHGSLLKDEIEDMLHVTQVETGHDTKRDWAFYREAAKTQLWPTSMPNISTSCRESQKACNRKAASSTSGT
jgi:hypothetical protein